ncbi:MAG: glycosyltransferase family 2 protein [bacterium]|nr:glycosyltransferase family 2 protein [bacterium]
MGILKPTTNNQQPRPQGASSEACQQLTTAPAGRFRPEGRPFLSVVIPIYNEVENIDSLYRALEKELDGIKGGAEVIAVDDGSSDGSFDLLRSMLQKNGRWRIIRLRRNFGQTAAMTAGFDLARGEVIITLDGDLQNDPADIPQLLAKMEEGYDVVSGWREKRRDKFVTRRLPSMIANRLISRLTGVALHDYGCTLKAYRSDVIKGVHLYGELHRFIPALAGWMGVRVAEIKVRHHPRRAGKSKYGLSRTVRVMLDLITVKFMLTSATRPMQVFGLFGMIASSLGLIGGIYMTLLKFIYHVSIGGRPLLLMFIMLIFVGIQFISIGLLGELVIRTYHEAQSKPIYAIREIAGREE